MNEVRAGKSMGSDGAHRLAAADIWEQRGTLTRVHDQSGGAEVPPLPDERSGPGLLRDILREFVAASRAERDRYTLILENGQAFSADDIAEMLARADSPFERDTEAPTK